MSLTSNLSTQAKGHTLGPTRAKAGYVMTDLEKDARKRIDNRLGPSKQSHEAERQRVVEEHIMDLREILKKLRKLFNLRPPFTATEVRGWDNAAT